MISGGLISAEKFQADLLALLNGTLSKRRVVVPVFLETSRSTSPPGRLRITSCPWLRRRQAWARRASGHRHSINQPTEHKKAGTHSQEIGSIFQAFNCRVPTSRQACSVSPGDALIVHRPVSLLMEKSASA